MTVFSNRDNVEREVLAADLVIGAVLIPGATAPKLVTRDDAAEDEAGRGDRRRRHRPGRLLSRRRGRPPTPSRPTSSTASCTTAWPTCRARVPRTSTYALNNATLPFVLALADKGWKQALRDDPHLLAGLNVCAGQGHLCRGGRGAGLSRGGGGQSAVS